MRALHVSFIWFCLLAAACSSRGTTPASVTSPQAVPVKADDASGATLVAVGDYSGCALTRAGGLSCWGSTAEEGEPGVEEKVRALANLADLALHDMHACAIDKAGVLHCWGDNSMGALGLPVPRHDGGDDTTGAGNAGGAGVDADAEEPLAYMARPLGDTAVVDVSAGTDMTCAVTRVGEVQCMGTLFAAEKPLSGIRAVPGIDDAVQVAIGLEHGCVVTRAGEVACWGENSYGEVSPPTDDDDDAYPESDGWDPSFDDTDMGGDDDDDDGDGGDDDDDDGDGGDDDDDDDDDDDEDGGGDDGYDPRWDDGYDGEDEAEAEFESLESDEHFARFSPELVDGVSEVVEVAVADDFSCARRRDGQVFCWGSKDYGVVGSSSTESPAPTAVEGLDHVVSLAARSQHACAVERGGTVACWGNNAHGQLGDGSTSSSVTPVRVKGIDNARQVAVSAQTSCAVLHDGSVRCWGRARLNAFGKDVREPPFVAVPELRASRVFAFDNTSCARVEDSGELVCWGGERPSSWRQGAAENVRRRALPMLGPVTSPPAALVDAWNGICALFEASRKLECWSPYGINARSDKPPVLELDDVEQVVSANSFACALRGDRSVWCYGRGRLDLGNGAPESADKPIRVSALRDVRHLAAASGYVCAVQGDGSLWCLGSYPAPADSGNASATSAPAFRPPARIADVSDALEVAGTGHALCVRTSRGRVRCTAIAGEEPRELVDLGLADVAEIGANLLELCARTHTGAVSCWRGSAVRGAIEAARASGKALRLAKPIEGLTDLAAMSAGDFHTCGRRQGGRVVCWGLNDVGQLGQVPRSLVLAPVEVYAPVSRRAKSLGQE